MVILTYFTGFGITGAVHTRSQTIGPPAISIELVAPEDPQKVLQISQTDETGQYVFFGVLPGRYILRIGEEDKLKYDFDYQQHQVDVGEDVGTSKPFQIQGYRINGGIMTDNGVGMANVKFLLNTSTGKNIKSTQTNAEGLFVFTNVDNGDYVVKMDPAESENQKLELVSSEMPVKVEHHHESLSENFIIKSFTLEGQVVASDRTKHPLPDVKIKATFRAASGGMTQGEDDNSVGTTTTTTDKAGKFQLKGVQSGSPLKVKAILDGHDFEAVSIASVTPR